MSSRLHKLISYGIQVKKEFYCKYLFLLKFEYGYGDYIKVLEKILYTLCHWRTKLNLHAIDLYSKWIKIFLSFWLCPYLLWLMRKLFSFLAILFTGLQYFHPEIYFRFSSSETFFDIFGPITKRKFSEELKPQWIEYIMQYVVISKLISCGNGVATETKNVPKSSGFSRLDRFQAGSFNVF